MPLTEVPAEDPGPGAESGECPFHKVIPIPGSVPSALDPVSPLRSLLAFLRAEGEWIAQARAAGDGGGVFRANLGVPVVVVTDPAAARQVLEAPLELVDRQFHNGFGPTQIRPEVAGHTRPSLTTRGSGTRHDRELLIEWTRRRAPAVHEALPACLDRATRAWARAGRVELPTAMGDLIGDLFGTALLGARISGAEIFAFNEAYLTPRTSSGLVNRAVAALKPATAEQEALGWSLQQRLIEGPLFEEARELGASLGLDAAQTANIVMMCAVLNASTAGAVFCSSALVELTGHPDHVDKLLAEVGDRALEPSVLAASPTLKDTLLELHRLYHRPRAFFKEVQKPFVLVDSRGRGFQVSPGELLMVHASTVHRDPGVFDHPDRFRPERFQESPDSRRFVWAYGSQTRDNYTCVGQLNGIADEVYFAVIVGLLRDLDWKYPSRPRLGLNHRWDLGPDPFELVEVHERKLDAARLRFAVIPGPEVPDPAVQTRFGLADRIKMRIVMAARAVNLASIERWSRFTFRKADPLDDESPPLVPAREHYDSAILPEVLKVPAHIPKRSMLTPDYVFPYYIVTGGVFKIFEHLPLSTRVRWTPDADYNDWFPAHPEGWRDIQDDAAFTAMRVHGPNPYLLQKVKKNTFVADFGPRFQGIHPPVKATFVVGKDGLEPRDIAIDGVVHKRGSAGWERAKFVFNALDARYTVFIRHLMYTHLIAGQAFTVATYSLASDHPLRPFMDFFTYGTLVVNDYAFKLLVTPASYFLQCNFLGAEDVGRLFQNYVHNFTMDRLIPTNDIRKRGVDEIPGNPYAEDVPEIWQMITEVVRNHVMITHPNDDAVTNDFRLQEWYARIVEIVPDRNQDAHPLNSVEYLVSVLSAMVYLNVYHEIVGDFSPFTMDRTRINKQLINMDNLWNADLGAPRAADVFLFTQGAWAGRFQNTGNALMTMDLDEKVSAPTLRNTLRGLQARMVELDRKLEARNRERTIPFLRVMPRNWKASISY